MTDGSERWPRDGRRGSFGTGRRRRDGLYRGRRRDRPRARRGRGPRGLAGRGRHQSVGCAGRRRPDGVRRDPLRSRVRVSHPAWFVTVMGRYPLVATSTMRARSRCWASRPRTAFGVASASRACLSSKTLLAGVGRVEASIVPRHGAVLRRASERTSVSLPTGHTPRLRGGTARCPAWRGVPSSVSAAIPAWMRCRVRSRRRTGSIEHRNADRSIGFQPSASRRSIRLSSTAVVSLFAKAGIQSTRVESAT